MATDELERAPEESSIDEFMSDPAVQRGLAEWRQALRQSCRGQGDAYFWEGKAREAIEEYQKDTELAITTYAQAAIVEQAYCHMGDAYLALGELDQAIAAYSRAVELWRQYGYGELPLASLAAAYIEQGLVDDAIRVCEENPQDAEDPAVQQVLAQARHLKSGGELEPGSVRGCRRIQLPFRVTSDLSSA